MRHQILIRAETRHKGLSTHSQGSSESPRQTHTFAMSMRKMPGLRAIQRSQAGPESNKACYVLTSQAVETRRAKYGEESDSDHRHAEASGGGDRRRSGTFEEAGGEHFD